MVGHIIGCIDHNFSTANRLKWYSSGQFVFGCNMIIPIKHMVDWELIHQQKQTQINKYHIKKNSKRFYHAYKIVDKVMLNNNSALKYETPYKVPFDITQCWTNGMVTLKYGVTKIRYNICLIKP